MGDVLEVPEVPEVPDETTAGLPAQEPVPGPAPAAAPRPRRRGRTTLLIAVAAVLGVVAGTCTGFLVQADRAPDKLPSLSQATLPQAKGPVPEPLTAAQDRQVKTGGDLRKLLLKRPSGARDAIFPVGSDGWLTLAGYSELFTKPDGAFSYDISEEFRRVAVTSWSEGDRQVEIHLVQYRQEEVQGAFEASNDAHQYAKHGSGSWSIPGTGDGMAYVNSSDGSYGADAYAWRGDVAMEIWVYDSKPVPKKAIMDLAKRQMERL